MIKEKLWKVEMIVQGEHSNNFIIIMKGKVGDV